MKVFLSFFPHPSHKTITDKQHHWLRMALNHWLTLGQMWCVKEKTNEYPDLYWNSQCFKLELELSSMNTEWTLNEVRGFTLATTSYRCSHYRSDLLSPGTIQVSPGHGRSERTWRPPESPFTPATTEQEGGKQTKSMVNYSPHLAAIHYTAFIIHHMASDMSCKPEQLLSLLESGKPPTVHHTEVIGTDRRVVANAPASPHTLTQSSPISPSPWKVTGCDMAVASSITCILPTLPESSCLQHLQDSEEHRSTVAAQVTSWWPQMFFCSGPSRSYAPLWA